MLIFLSKNRLLFTFSGCNLLRTCAIDLRTRILSKHPLNIVFPKDFDWKADVELPSLPLASAVNFEAQREQKEAIFKLFYCFPQ